MLPVSTLYDEYIDRRKLTEQKKPIWVYSSSPLKRCRDNERFSKNDKNAIEVIMVVTIEYQQS